MENPSVLIESLGFTLAIHLDPYEVVYYDPIKEYHGAENFPLDYLSADRIGRLFNKALPKINKSKLHNKDLIYQYVQRESMKYSQRYYLKSMNDSKKRQSTASNSKISKGIQ